MTKRNSKEKQEPKNREYVFIMMTPNGPLPQRVMAHSFELHVSGSLIFRQWNVKTKEFQNVYYSPNVWATFKPGLVQLPEPEPDSGVVVPEEKRVVVPFKH